MKQFFKKSFSFTFCFIGIYSFFYIISSHYFRRATATNSVYIYGDSQTVQGLDLEELKHQTGLKIFTSAKHGSGIYDFLFFTTAVPKNSKVILSISQHSQIRPDINEANTSPLNPTPLLQLYNNGYSSAGFKNIFFRGVKIPKSNYFKKHLELYPTQDSISHHTTKKVFIDLYNSITEKELQQKQDMYFKGIQNLINKNCKITFIEFPYNRELQQIKERTRLNKKFNQFKVNISNLYKNFKTDSLVLKSNKNIMYDYTHLNTLGAKILTTQLTETIKSNPEKTLYLKFSY